MYKGAHVLGVFHEQISWFDKHDVPWRAQATPQYEQHAAASCAAVFRGRLLTDLPRLPVGRV